MNTMNVPGFFAEASLYRSSGPYQIAAALAGLKQEGEVVPSIWLQDPTEIEGGAFDAGCDDRAGICYTTVRVGGSYLNTICGRDGCWQFWF
jgi:hypothetical protein